MKSKVRVGTALSLCLALAVAVFGVAMAALSHGRQSAPAYAAEAEVTPEPQAVKPEKTAGCPFCTGRQALVIDSAAGLRWLFDNSRTAEELAGCYILDLPEVTVNGVKKKMLNITGWTDTGVGECAKAGETFHTKDHSACAKAFTGHFYGNGCTLEYAFSRDKAASASGAMGLFPCLKGARVEELNLSVVMTTLDAGQDQAAGSNNVGALCYYAGGGTRIAGVNVTQSFVQAETLNVGSGVGGGRAAGGVAGFNDTDSAIVNCNVTLLPGLLNGAAAPNTLLHLYGGIASLNNGKIENCTFRYAGGENGLFHNSGGIAYINCGTITNCASALSASGLSFLNSGGITHALDGGAISNCTAEIDADRSNALAETSVTGAGGISYYANRSYQLGYMDVGPSAIRDCLVTGGTLGGVWRVGGILGCLTMPNGRTEDGKVIGAHPVEITGCKVQLQAIGTYITERRGSIGGLVGEVEIQKNVTVADCVSHANMYGGSDVAGLVGVVNCTVVQDTLAAGELYTFTLKNCTSYASEVKAGCEVGNADSGGAIGIVYYAKGNYRCVITDNEAYADVISPGKNLGGFWGAYSGSYATAEDVRDQSSSVIARNAAYGNVTGSGVIGGFSGGINPAIRNLVLEDCRAYGSAKVAEATTTANNIAGGFIGVASGWYTVFRNCFASGDTYAYNYVGGFMGQSAGVADMTFENCTAEGNAHAQNFSAGGFAGEILSSEGFSFNNCVAKGSAKAETNMVGGFIGGIYSQLNTSTRAEFRNCTAYGETIGAGNVGGFIGRAIRNNDGTIYTSDINFIGCKAYGQVSPGLNDDGSLKWGQTWAYGGFMGYSNSNKLYFTQCTAYGNVRGSTVGGFFGYVGDGTELVSFTACTAYGDVDDSGPTGSYEAGGFVGILRATGNPAIFSNCWAYGDINTPKGDCGGFIGPSRMVMTVDNCHSRANKIIGNPTMTAGFAAIWETGNTGSKFTNCTYTKTAANLSFFVYYGGAAAGNVSVDKADAAMQANPVDKNSFPIPALNCSVTLNASGDVVIAYTGLKFITGYVTDFAVSLDGGKSFTQLVYTDTAAGAEGYVLTPVAGVAVGGKITAGNFTYTLKNPQKTGLGNVVVRIAFSDGFSLNTRA